MDSSIFLTVGFICSIIAACVAHARGRNVIGWAVGGFFFGAIGVLIVACLPKQGGQQTLVGPPPMPGQWQHQHYYQQPQGQYWQQGYAPQQPPQS